MSSEKAGSTGVYDVLAWIEVNKTRVIIGVVAVVVLGFAWRIAAWKAEETALAADEQIFRLRFPFSPGQPGSAAATDYLKVASDHPGTGAAPRAMLLAAGAFYSEGRFSEAKTQFEKFLQEHGSHPMAPTAAYGMATSLEGLGNADGALAAYQSLMTRYPKAALTEDAKLAVARLYEAKNQPQQALQTYEDLGRTTVMSQQTVEASRRKEALLKKHPELAPAKAATGSTNSPAATNAAPPARP